MKKPCFFTYLLSSLPMLHFGQKAPLSFETFLEKCENSISEEDFNILSSLPHVMEDKELQKAAVVQEFFEFETSLRNELVKLRAARKHIDPNINIREVSFFDSQIPHIALNAYKSISILEAERILDLTRWQRLDDLGQGHFFDLDALVIYAFKLLILLRWDNIKAADSAKALEEALVQQQ